MTPPSAPPSSSPRSELRAGDRLARHLHSAAYATLVLSGGYEEAGEGGRWRVGPGDVLLHAPFSAHWNHCAGRGARLLNLPLPPGLHASGAMRLADADAIVRWAEKDPQAAVGVLLAACRPGPPPAEDLPDLLALALSDPDACGVDEWARRHGVSRQTAFRWFRSAYGVGPARYRVEARARCAWLRIVEGHEDLVTIAAAAGFADQAHMCRDVRALTGRTPTAWRRVAATFVQDRQA